MAKMYITLRDIAAGKTPQGLQDREIVELIAKHNPILQDILWQECNKGRENFSTVRAGYPTAVFRAFYEGIAPSKTAKKQVVNSCATISTALEIDKRLYAMESDKEALHLDEAEAHTEVMSELAAKALFWGDITDDPRGINGLAKTYSVLCGTSTDDTKASYYTIDGKLSGSASVVNLRSIFLVGWGRNAVKGLFPQGSNMGIQRDGLKEAVVQDDGGKSLQVMREEYNWDLGLEIKDLRCAGAIRNIQTALTGTFTNNAFSGKADITAALRSLIIRVRAPGDLIGDPTSTAHASQVLYMDKTTFEFIDTEFHQMTQGNAVKYADAQQSLPASILGIPVRLCDALNYSQTALITDTQA